MKNNLFRVLLIFGVCFAIPSTIFLANLVVVYTNFPKNDALKKMTLVAFAERSGFRLRPALHPRLQADLEDFQLSNGFIAGEVCEICSKTRSSCHRDLAKETQRWIRYTFEAGPAWVPLKNLQPSLMALALEYKYDDAMLLKMIAYARLLHSSFSAMDELCVQRFKHPCNLLTLDENIQIDVGTILFAFERLQRSHTEALGARLRAARSTCGIKN